MRSVHSSTVDGTSDGTTAPMLAVIVYSDDLSHVM